MQAAVCAPAMGGNAVPAVVEQLHNVGVAHKIMDCFEVLLADDSPDDASPSSSLALAAQYMLTLGL